VRDAIDVDRELQQLEAGLRQLEAEYNMYFAGRLPRPPVETRARVLALTRKIDNLRITNYAERFRFTTLQSRFQTFVDLWDRGLRAREEGRAGPFAPRSPAAPKGRPEAKVLHVASFREPGHEMEKLHELYDRLAEARRTVGEEAIPFHKFADLVKDQVKKLKEQGSPEVAFRVAVKDGKVNFTARGMKGSNEGTRTVANWKFASELAGRAVPRPSELRWRPACSPGASFGSVRL
jgi:hypothetical protein